MSKPTQSMAAGQYESVAEFIADANLECRNAKSKGIVGEWLNSDRGAWYGANCRTGKDVDKLVTNGWTEGRQRVDAFLTKLSTIELAPRDMRRRLYRTDFGDHLDIGAIYAGRFQTAWSVARRQTGFGPQRVDVVANMLCAGDESSEVLFWRGAAAVAFCDKLEAAGYMVRLIVGFGDMREHYATKKLEGGVSCRVTVKNHGMPMDIATASAVILPGFFRSIGHRWIGVHNPNQQSRGGISVGQCQIDEGEIFLSHEVRDETSAKRWVESQIAKLEPTEEAA